MEISFTNLVMYSLAKYSERHPLMKDGGLSKKTTFVLTASKEKARRIYADLSEVADSAKELTTLCYVERKLRR